MRKWMRPATLVGLLVLFSLGASAEPATPNPEVEQFRGELLLFLEDLRGVSSLDTERIEEARVRVEALDEDALLDMQLALAPLPQWRALPKLASLLAQSQRVLIELNEKKLELVELRERLERRNRTGSLTPEDVEEVVSQARSIRRYLERLHGDEENAELLQTLEAMGNPIPLAALGCGGGCSITNLGACFDIIGCLEDLIDDLVDAVAAAAAAVSNFISGVGSVITSIGQELVALATTVGTFFSDLFNSMVGAIDDLVTFIDDNFPTSPEELAGVLGLDDPDWFNDLLGAIPILEPPCPEIGVQIPGIGEVGSARAEWVCKRGIDWFAALLYDLVPDDVIDIPVKIPATLIYYPINYFCLCMESQSALSFSDAQVGHRGLVDDHLNAVLSTRATQLSAEALRASLADLDGDVVVTEAKLDLLDGKADELDALQDGQGLFLQAFRRLVVRMNIEENLLDADEGDDEDDDEGDDTVGLFQFPDALGGFLEEVRSIVDETIQSNLLAGQPVFQAQQLLAQGDQRVSEGNYKAAYSFFGRAYRDAVRLHRHDD